MLAYLPGQGTVVYVRSEIRASALDDDDCAEILDHEPTLRYADIVLNDSILAGAFHQQIAEEPAFASTRD